MQPTTSPTLSVVVPLLNEADSLRPLCERLTASLAEVSELYEVIFVDDGSTDASPTVLEDLYRNDREHVRVIQFRRNFGKTAGLNAGFAHARGRVIVTMDADLQDDPAEIPVMLAKLDEGYDLVAAWRVDRRDPLEKTLPSRFFNFIVSRFTGVDLHDFNCGFKVYRRAVTDSVRLYPSAGSPAGLSHRRGAGSAPSSPGWGVQIRGQAICEGFLGLWHRAFLDDVSEAPVASLWGRWPGCFWSRCDYQPVSGLPLAVARGRGQD
jgi:glycosyltransferase involved in cell wall biosynthesis